VPLPEHFPSVQISWPNLTMTLASPVVEKNTPMGQLGLAQEFFGAARASVNSEQFAIRPTYWEISHAIELALKAFLLSKGVTEEELMKKSVRHNLERLVDMAIKRDLALPDDVVGVIQGMSLAHRSFYFRYGHEEQPPEQITATITVPFVGDAITAAQNLLDACGAHIARP
jgi:hypothetical protein